MLNSLGFYFLAQVFVSSWWRSSLVLGFTFKNQHAQKPKNNVLQAGWLQKLWQKIKQKGGRGWGVF